MVSRVVYIVSFKAVRDYIVRPLIKNKKGEKNAGGINQWLRTLAAGPKDLSSVPSTHVG